MFAQNNCFNCDNNTKAFTIGTNNIAIGQNSFSGGNYSKAFNNNAFVKVNKHFPDVAPAAEMEAEGINLSEMNALFYAKLKNLRSIF